MLTVRHSNTVRYSTNDYGHPTYTFNNTETRPHPYISKRAKQSTTETQDINPIKRERVVYWYSI
jgi:hypothetical protein